MIFLKTAATAAMSAAAVVWMASAGPAAAAPNLSWGQYQIPISGPACADRAVQAMRSVYRWRLTPGRQHVIAKSRSMTGWIRCWPIRTASGPQSIVTVFVTGGPLKRGGRLVNDLGSFMRYGRLD